MPTSPPAIWSRWGAGCCRRPSRCCRRWLLGSERPDQSAQRVAEINLAVEIAGREDGFLRPALCDQFRPEHARQQTRLKRRGQQHVAAPDKKVAARPFGQFAAL